MNCLNCGRPRKDHNTKALLNLYGSNPCRIFMTTDMLPKNLKSRFRMSAHENGMDSTLEIRLKKDDKYYVIKNSRARAKKSVEGEHKEPFFKIKFDSIEDRRDFLGALKLICENLLNYKRSEKTWADDSIM